LQEGRSAAVRPLDFYDAKGAVEAALHAIGVSSVKFSSAEVDHLRTGQSAAIEHSGQIIGHVGRLADSIAASYKFRQNVFVAEVNLQTLLHSSPKPARYRPLAKYPAIVRDVSFLVKRHVEYASIENAIRKQGFDLCRNILFIDSYEGKGVAEDERSLTIRLEYRSDERTLIEDEVEQVHKNIVEGVLAEFGSTVRV
jgi:phenylalanyl-tRNA synthetase beta chain